MEDDAFVDIEDIDYLFNWGVLDGRFVLVDYAWLD